MMLYETYDVLSNNGMIHEDLIPSFVTENITERFPLRLYQKEAMARFSYALEDSTNLNYPLHILFHMATGSGKTLIMASNILHLYEKGYRRFLFVVNSKEIVRKTRENFLNNTSRKHLFQNPIVYNGINIHVNPVDNFDEMQDDSINIIFTTIQGLREKILVPRENSMTVEDFAEDKVVILSDEAHHSSRDTKEEKENKDTWENIILTLLEAHDDNILLEYTATAETQNNLVREKYKDKIIYNYDLKSFRRDKYSKEVKVLQSDVNNMDRILQSLLVSQYRKKIAEKYRLNHFKPVILVKTKSKENAEVTHSEFQSMLGKIDGEKIKRMYPSDDDDNLLVKAFKFFEEESIEYSNLARELKMDFSNDENQMVIYSGNDEEEKQLLLNNLEDQDNQIRIIFVVKKLTEGWDVLNLFDIVRTDENSTGGKTPTQDAQLIGRGARYYPFKIDDEQSKFKRKYDDNIQHPLRGLEELYYYSVNNPSYIRNLHRQLDRLGLGDGGKRKVNLSLKESFKENPLYQSGYIFLNKQKQRDLNQFTSLNKLGINQYYFDVMLKTGTIQELDILESNIEIKTESLIKNQLDLSEVSFQIVRKALQNDAFYHFNNLTKYLPNLKSLKEFIESEDYLGQIKIALWRGENDKNILGPDEYLYIIIKVLKRLKSEIETKAKAPYGTTEFYPRAIKELPFEKEMEIINDPDVSREQSSSTTDDETRYVNVENENWFVYQNAYRNTSEEQFLIRLIHDMYEKYKEEFSGFHLIRNEKLFKLYRFSDGKGFEPDFLIIAKRKEEDKDVTYQIFVEPKGEHLKEHDSEKEEFLNEIAEEARLYSAEGREIILFDTNNYRIIGLPFFNNKKERVFKEKIESIFNIE